MTMLQHCWRTMAITLAFLASGAVQAQSPDASRKDQAACAIVARTVLAIAPPVGGARGPWQNPLDALDTASAGVVRIDAEAWRGGKKELLDRLSRGHRAEPGLLAAVGALAGDDGTYFLHRFGKSSLYLAEIVEGSANCQRFVFFAAQPTGRAHAMSAPPVVENAEPMTFCVRTTAHAGEVASVPALIAEYDRDSTVELSITPWREGGWQPACRLVIRFSDVFETTDRFCKGVDCRKMEDQALALVRKVDRQPQAAQEDAATRGEKFQAMKALAERGLEKQLPTFGGETHGAFGSAVNDFAEEAVLLPVSVDGETYLARVGHAAVGWRRYPDYLFAAYKPVGDRLAPVAGLYISKTRGKPTRVTAD